MFLLEMLRTQKALWSGFAAGEEVFFTISYNKEPPKPYTMNTDVGALIIRIRFCEVYFTIVTRRKPQNPILIIKAPTLKPYKVWRANLKLLVLNREWGNWSL